MEKELYWLLLKYKSIARFVEIQKIYITKKIFRFFVKYLDKLRNSSFFLSQKNTKYQHQPWFLFKRIVTRKMNIEELRLILMNIERESKITIGELNNKKVVKSIRE